ncbi:MAG TPA: YraN family protein [Alphaproteobacteria bacterium]
MGSVDTYKSGLIAEAVAGWFLAAKGYRVLAKRFKTPVGEIDLVVKRGRTVAFIEVKRRLSIEEGLYAVHPGNAARVRRAAEWWLKANPAFADKCDLRFDVVVLSPYRLIRHISNAF